MGGYAAGMAAQARRHPDATLVLESVWIFSFSLEEPMETWILTRLSV